jgi:LysM repeat protein
MKSDRRDSVLPLLLMVFLSLLTPACIVASEEAPRGTVVRLTTPTAPPTAASATPRPVAVVTPTLALPETTAGPTVALPPTAGPTTAPGGQATTTTYTVREGDTLFALSRRTGVSVAELARMNGIASDSLLRIGQQLQLPAAPSTGTSISVASPERGATVRSPIVIQGSASTFEGVVNIEVLDTTGALLATGSTIANQPDAGRAGPFRAEIIVPGPGNRQVTLRVFWRSPRDGSPMDEIRLPLTLVG